MASSTLASRLPHHPTHPLPNTVIRETVTIINKLGLHARAAAKFSACASQFEADIAVERNDYRVNGKSIMGIMMLAASQGSDIILIIEGTDEQDALESLKTLINNRFEENE